MAASVLDLATARLAKCHHFDLLPLSRRGARWRGRLDGNLLSFWAKRLAKCAAWSCESAFRPRRTHAPCAGDAVMGMFDGKKGLILGVANDRSIAWAIAQVIMKE